MEWKDVNAAKVRFEQLDVEAKAMVRRAKDAKAAWVETAAAWRKQNIEELTKASMVKQFGNPESEMYRMADILRGRGGCA